MSCGPEHRNEIVTPGRPQTREVSDCVFAYIQPDGTWWINNTGFLTGPQGVISIDTCSTERRTRAYRVAIAAITPAPVRAVVNTHHHGDHTFGNALFKTRISKNVRLEESPAYKETVFSYAPKSSGAEDYKKLAQEVLQRVEEDRVARHSEDAA